jgi:hypothetical protein
MTTSEERLKILKMIDDGKINAEEGAKLLSALRNIASKYAPDIAFDELIASINDGAQGKIIDVIDEEDGEHVEIFIE